MTTRKRPAVPYDIGAERAMVGGALQWPDRLEGVADDLAAEDFYDRKCRRAWEVVLTLISERSSVDRLTVLDRAGEIVEPVDLAELMNDALPPLREHVDIILRHSASRKVLMIENESLQALRDGEDPYAVASRTAADLDQVGSMSAHSQVEAMTLQELIASAADTAPWVIPGLVRADWRVVVVAGEGLGKSTLLRQLAISSSQGLHPLMHQPMEAIRSLIVDAENPLAAIAESGGRLDTQAQRSAGDNYDPGRCKVWSRPGGLDLRSPRIGPIWCGRSGSSVHSWLWLARCTSSEGATTARATRTPPRASWPCWTTCGPDSDSPSSSNTTHRSLRAESVTCCRSARSGGWRGRSWGSI